MLIFANNFFILFHFFFILNYLYPLIIGLIAHSFVYVMYKKSHYTLGLYFHYITCIGQ